MKLFLIFLLLAITIPGPINAQELISLQGRLRERGTKRPMKQVNIFILPGQFKVTTDDRGLFSVAQIPVGDCRVIVNQADYQRLELQNVCQKSQDNLEWYLERASYHAFETTVTTKAAVRDTQTQSLTQEQFMTMPGSFGGDPVRATQNLPGVGMGGMSAAVIVQGASPDDTGYLINGHRVPLIFHFGGLSSVIVPDAVERVDLLPSGYGPEYSKAMGGIISLETRQAKKDRMHGMAYIDLFNTGFLFEGPGKDESEGWLVSGRYAYIGQVLQAVANEEEDFNFTAAPTYYDFNANYSKKIDDRNDVKASFIFSRDELRLVLAKAQNSDRALRGNFKNTTEFFRLIPEWTSRYDDGVAMKHSLALGQDKLFVDISGKYLDVDSKKLSQRSEISKQWSSRNKSYLGLDNEWNWSEVLINLPKVDAIGGVQSPFSSGDNRKYTTKNSDGQYGLYLRQEWKWADESRWTLLPNMRFEHFSLTEESFVSPRFQVRYHIDPSLHLRSSWGIYRQAPLPQETSPNYGNPDIKSPYAEHWTVGWTKDFDTQTTQGLELINNYFYKKLHYLAVPDVATNYNNSGTGDVLGMEWQAKYKSGEWTGQAVYTLLKSRRSIPGYGRHPSEFDQTHNLNLIGSYRREKWTYGGRFRYITGSPFTPVASASFDSDNDVYIPRLGPLFSKRFDDFLQLDIRIDRKFIYDTWILTAYLDIQNLTNSSKMATAQYLDYSYDYSQTEEIDGLPILPTLGVKGEF
jgi:hypothetical protein